MRRALASEVVRQGKDNNQRETNGGGQKVKKQVNRKLIYPLLNNIRNWEVITRRIYEVWIEKNYQWLMSESKLSKIDMTG